MNYPLISEYIEAIKSAEDNFDELKYLRPVLNDDGMPIMSVGGFSVVFKMKDERDGKNYAVKCFTKEQEGRAESYRLIADELEFVSTNYLVQVKYLEKELYVDTKQTEEDEFPVLLMDWVEGKTLDKYLLDNSENTFLLELLAYQFCKMASWLLAQPFAHGDLKPDNILIKNNGSIVLVDYDGMYVPAMKGENAREQGSPGFRHLTRINGIFDEHIDDFPIALISMALKAYSINPELLNEYCNNDIMFFSEKDYSHIHLTKAMMAILEIVDNEELCSLFGAFMVVLAKGNLSLVSPKLYRLRNPKTETNYGEYIYNQARSFCDEAKDKSKIDRKKAFKLFQKAAKLGNSDAQCCLGCCYRHGYGTDVNYTEALDCYVESSNNGCARALRHIAMCYEYGKGKEKDIFKAIDYYLKAASEGDYYSHVCIGKAYESGTDVEKDLVKAFGYFAKAANNGNAEGQRRVGVCYHAGQGVERDYDKGIYWLKQSAFQNDDIAQKLLAFCFYKGDGVKQDFKKAVQWYQLSAQNGNTVSQLRLGECYLYGIGIEQNDIEALRCFKLAKEAGDVEAQEQFGHHVGSINKHILLAQEGNVVSQLQLGKCYLYGIGVEQNYEKALELFKLAANANCTVAQRLLGVCYYKGYGTKKEYKIAIKNFYKSAIHGDIKAKYYIGVCYELGKGVEKNCDKAKEWFELAAKQGNLKAKIALNRLEKDYKNDHN